LNTDHRVPTVATGLAFTGAAIAWAGASWVQGNLLARVARHHLIAVGALILAASIAAAAAGTIPGTPAYTGAVALVSAAVGMGMLVPSLTALALANTTADRQGYASSAMQTTQNLGQCTVMALASICLRTFAGPASADPAGYGAAFALLLIPSFATALVAARTTNAA
jgi:MFS family permease